MGTKLKGFLRGIRLGDDDSMAAGVEVVQLDGMID